MEPGEVPAGIAPERPKRGGEHRAESVLLRVASGVGSERIPTLGLMEAHVDATYTREIGAVRLIRGHPGLSTNAADGADDRPECPVSGAEFVHLASDGTKLVAQRRWMRHVEVVQPPPAADADAEAVPLEDWLATRGEALGGDDLAGTRALIWWPADGACYPCTVERFRNVGGNVGHHGAHVVRYDDGQRETVHLALQTFAALEPPPLDEPDGQPTNDGPEEMEGADGGADGGAETSPPKPKPRVFERVCWFAPRGGETAAEWRRERRRRARRRARGVNVDGNAPALNVDVGPEPRDSPTGSPEDGAGEDEEGLVGPGGVPGSTGNRRKRNRKSSDEIEDGKEPPD